MKRRIRFTTTIGQPPTYMNNGHVYATEDQLGWVIDEPITEWQKKLPNETSLATLRLVFTDTNSSQFIAYPHEYEIIE